MNGNQVFSLPEIGRRVWQRDRDPARLPSAARVVIEGQLALFHIVAQHLGAVDPDDSPVIDVLVEHQGVGDAVRIVDGEGVAHVDRGVGSPHIGKLRVVVAISESDGGLRLQPGFVQGEVVFTPALRRIGGLRGTRPVAPVLALSPEEIDTLGKGALDEPRGSPASGEVVVAAGVEQLHGAALALCGQRPGKAGLVVDLVDPGACRIAQGQCLSAVVKASLPRAAGALEGQVVSQDSRILGDYEIVPGRQEGAVGKGKDDSIGEIPTGEIHRRFGCVVQLDEFFGGRLVFRFVVDFVDDDLGIESCGKEQPAGGQKTEERTIDFRHFECSLSEWAARGRRTRPGSFFKSRIFRQEKTLKPNDAGDRRTIYFTEYPGG